MCSNNEKDVMNETTKELLIEDLRPLKDFPTELILAEADNFMVGKAIINNEEIQVIIVNTKNVIPCSFNNGNSVYNVDRFEERLAYDQEICEVTFKSDIFLTHDRRCKNKKIEGCKKCSLHNFELKFTNKAEELQRERVKKYLHGNIM